MCLCDSTRVSVKIFTTEGSSLDSCCYLAILPNMVTKPKLGGELKTHMECRAKVMKALAHPSRLFIVDELSRGERCVCELTEMIGADVSTVSKHLAVLREAGLVLDERRGVQVFYRLRPTSVEAHR